MKAYAVLSLLLVCNVDGNKIVESSGRPQIIVQNPNAIVHEQLNKLDPGDELVFDPFLEETPLETLPETEKDLKNRVLLYLFTRDNPLAGKQLYVDDVHAFKQSNFNFSKPTKIVTHGWFNTLINGPVTLVRDAYFQNGDYNVIGIDWTKIAFKPYLWASRRVPMVGRYVASFINFLQTQGMDLSTLTIVGHSLGAHVAGLAARFAEGNVDHVVALDPALPSFITAGPDERVSCEDARYVEVIHTDGGILGYAAAIGDVDFYPNGGSLQPGCDSNVCSHLRAYIYFAESLISDKGFVAVKCDSYANFLDGKCNSNPTTLMGGSVPNYDAKGSYYLKVNKFYSHTKF